MIHNEDNSSRFTEISKIVLQSSSQVPHLYPNTQSLTHQLAACACYINIVNAKYIVYCTLQRYLIVCLAGTLSVHPILTRERYRKACAIDFPGGSEFNRVYLKPEYRHFYKSWLICMNKVKKVINWVKQLG